MKPTDLCLEAAKVLGLIRGLVAASNYHSACGSLRYASDLYGDAAKLFSDEDAHASCDAALNLRQHCLAQAMQIEMDTKK